jgi:hypothetical protein
MSSPGSPALTMSVTPIVKLSPERKDGATRVWAFASELSVDSSALDKNKQKRSGLVIVI